MLLYMCFFSSYYYKKQDKNVWRNYIEPQGNYYNCIFMDQ